MMHFIEKANWFRIVYFLFRVNPHEKKYQNPGALSEGLRYAHALILVSKTTMSQQYTHAPRHQRLRYKWWPLIKTFGKFCYVIRLSIIIASLARTKTLNGTDFALYSAFIKKIIFYGKFKILKKRLHHFFLILHFRFEFINRYNLI